MQIATNRQTNCDTFNSNCDILNCDILLISNKATNYYSYMQQHGYIPKTLCWAKQSRQRKNTYFAFTFIQRSLTGSINWEIDVNCRDFLGEYCIAWKEHKRTFWVMEMFYTLIVVMFIQVYTLVKTHLSVKGALCSQIVL